MEMNYSIVYSSKTGNTKALADALRGALPEDDCVYFGEPGTEALAADVIFTGFWTDKGNCDSGAEDFLRTVSGKKVFLFGTAGFGGSKEYYGGILAKAKQALNGTNTICGSFMCQGRMPASVRKRYEQMLAATPGDAKISGMLANFDAAATHPDENDLKSFTAEAARALQQ